MDAIHVYIHVPFCVDTCGYCDFYRQPYRADRERRYVEALIREIDMRVPSGARLASLYFGGGTPSLLTAAGWDAIFGALTKRAAFDTNAEISIEANPASVTPEAAGLWRRLGVNRVSVGVQSLNDGILAYLNRIHTAGVALAALDHLRSAGIGNVNADLIYGIERQDARDVVSDVDRLAPAITHLSAYALTIVAGTPFARKGVGVPPDDAVAEQYEDIVERAAAHGLDRYEVSNFARPGFECRHNQNTWRHGPYLALGPSGAGFDGRARYKNAPNLEQYIRKIADGLAPDSERETVSDETAFRDRLMLGLRTREGAALTDDEARRLRELAREAGVDGEVEWTAAGARLKQNRLAVLDEFLSRLQMSAAWN